MQKAKQSDCTIKITCLKKNYARKEIEEMIKRKGEGICINESF